MSRKEATNAIKLIASHFRRFRLNTHTGSLSKSKPSKTDLIFIPAPNHATDLIDKENILINKYRCISHRDTFQYLGSKIL